MFEIQDVLRRVIHSGLDHLLWLMLVLFGLPGNWLMVLNDVAVRLVDAGPAGGLREPWIAIAVLAVAGELIEFSGARSEPEKPGQAGGPPSRAFSAPSSVRSSGRWCSPCSSLAPLSVPARGGAGRVIVETSRGEHPELSLQRAVGAGMGEFLGILSKFAVGILIWLTVAVAAFWP